MYVQLSINNYILSRVPLFLRIVTRHVLCLDINKYSTNQCDILVQIDIDVRGEVQKHLPRIFPYMPPFLPPSSTASWRHNPESVVPVLVPLPQDLWWDSILSGS